MAEHHRKIQKKKITVFLLVLASLVIHLLLCIWYFRQVFYDVRILKEVKIPFFEKDPIVYFFSIFFFCWFDYLQSAACKVVEFWQLISSILDDLQRARTLLLGGQYFDSNIPFLKLQEVAQNNWLFSRSFEDIPIEQRFVIFTIYLGSPGGVPENVPSDTYRPIILLLFQFLDLYLLRINQFKVQKTSMIDFTNSCWSSSNPLSGFTLHFSSLLESVRAISFWLQITM